MSTDTIVGPHLTGDSYGIDRSQFAGRQPDGLISGDTTGSITPQQGEDIFPNIQIEPTISDTLKSSYNNSFASLPAPSSTVTQNNQQILNQISPIGLITQDLVDTLQQHDASSVKLASMILAQNQEALEAAQKLYEQYYAPGAPHADQVQGDRFPEQQISNSLETMQHVAGLALIQTTASLSTSETSQVGALLGSSEAPLADPVLARGLNITEASFLAGKSFLSLLGASHLQGVKSLSILRRLLTEMNVLHLHSVINQRDVKAAREINKEPRKILEEKGDEKNQANRLITNNILNNIVSNIGNRLSFFTKSPNLDPATIHNTESVESKRAAQHVVPPVASERMENRSTLQSNLRSSLEVEAMANQAATIEENTAADQLRTTRHKNKEANKNESERAPLTDLNAVKTSISSLSNQDFSYRITGNNAASVDTSTAISMEEGGPQVAAINTINISPTVMNAQLSKSLEKSLKTFEQLSKSIPPIPLNASLL